VEDTALTQLCREAVDSHNVVAFIKGTRWGNRFRV